MKKNSVHSLFYGAMLVLAGSNLAMAQGRITTFAGCGIAGLDGDGFSAINAKFSNPCGVALDAAGNVYVADKLNSRIRKISGSTGLISTFAGSTPGGAGLGGFATMAQMQMPDAVFVNAAGDVVITDWYRDMAYYVDHATGLIHGRCGNGSQGSSGDGGNSNLAKMMTPAGACEDPAGNTYIADKGSNRIRRVDAATGIVTTIVNNGGAFGYSGDGSFAMLAHMAGPAGVFFDPTSPGLGHLYISDAGNHVVRMVDLNTGIITTVAGTGSAGYSGMGVAATAAQLRNPGNLFIGSDNFLYICDRGNHVVRRMSLESGFIYTVAGNGTMGYSGDGGLATNAKLNDPEGVWVDNTGRMYIADAGNQRIRRVSVGSSIGSPFPIPKGIETTNDSKIEIFPNPSNGQFTLITGADFNAASIVVYNVIGVQVFSTTVSATHTDINLKGQPAGTYTISVRSAANVHTQKITIL